MRIIHTSDWHLGRLFYGLHLTDDQAHVLQQFVELVKSEKPDAVIVAGDIYDRTVPPPDAVTLLDEVLTKIAVERKVPVIMIAGNHDSPQRIAFGSRLLRSHQLFVVGEIPAMPELIPLADAHGTVGVIAMPYAEPAVVRERLGDETVAGHNAAMAALTRRARLCRLPGRNLLVAHAFVTGCEKTDSERPLSVGGSEFVDCNLFEGFDYVALGHLHRAQKVNGLEHMRYSGSLLKYSFEEADHQKMVLSVEVDAAGKSTVTPICFTPRRDTRTIRGTFQEILADEKRYPGSEDYLCVELEDMEPILDAMGRLRKRFPNLMHIERPGLASTQGGPTARVDHRKLDDLELFKAFHSQVCGADLDEVSHSELKLLLEAFARQTQEVPQ
jgi:DNA repair protein SbcD/Mre11